jgi:hypothetical protein
LKAAAAPPTGASPLSRALCGGLRLGPACGCALASAGWLSCGLLPSAVPAHYRVAVFVSPSNLDFSSSPARQRQSRPKTHSSPHIPNSQIYVLQLGSGRSFLFPGGFGCPFLLPLGFWSFIPPIPRELVVQSSFPGDKYHRGPKKKHNNLKVCGLAFFAFWFSLGIGRSSLLPQGFGRSFLSARL